MRLYVMRHGPTEDRAPTGRDFDRALTRAGRDVVARAAQALLQARRDAGDAPWRLLSSPLQRARETAAIVASIMTGPRAAPTVEIHDDLAADAGLPLDLVRALGAADTDALLIGHQPAVEALVRHLADPAPVPLPGGFRTALIVALDRLALDRWHPAAVLDPHRADR